jgi:tripeptide aminopeptidase
VAKIGFIVDGLELDTVVVGGPSHITLDIEIIGRTAHPAMEPEKGISAIRVAAKAIAAMPEGRIDDETTASVGTVHGGTVRNAVPERVAIQAECRSLDHDKCVQQAEVMQWAFEKAAEEVGAKAKIDLNIEYHASQIPEQAPAVQFATAAIAAVGLKPKVKAIMGGSDAFILSRKGVESVVVGYGGKSVHSSQEHIAIVDMERAVAILRHLLHSLG